MFHTRFVIHYWIHILQTLRWTYWWTCWNELIDELVEMNLLMPTLDSLYIMMSFVQIYMCKKNFANRLCRKHFNCVVSIPYFSIISLQSSYMLLLEIRIVLSKGQRNPATASSDHPRTRCNFSFSKQAEVLGSRFTSRFTPSVVHCLPLCNQELGCV